MILTPVLEQDILFKQFQKSPDNPYSLSFCFPCVSASLGLYRFNQVTVEYNATNEEKVDALRRRHDEVRDRLREKS